MLLAKDPSPSTNHARVAPSGINSEFAATALTPQSTPYLIKRMTTRCWFPQRVSLLVRQCSGFRIPVSNGERATRVRLVNVV
jgi:hypothetical protein